VVFIGLFILSVLDGQPLLASGGSSGVISIWNLEKKRLHSVVREAHDGVITSLHFFANEPVLMSSSADNSIKVSFFFYILFCKKRRTLVCMHFNFLIKLACMDNIIFQVYYRYLFLIYKKKKDSSL
jgi:WD40 repeat protein